MTSRSHHQYITHVASYLKEQPAQIQHRLQELAPAILLLSMLDLEPARELLRHTYAERPRGQVPRDPVSMLRALLLGVLLGEPSWTQLVARARLQPELGVLAGFEAGDFPGVGTFYDFCARLQDGSPALYSRHGERPSQRQSRRARHPQAKPRPNSKAFKKKAEREAREQAQHKSTRELLTTLLERQQQPCAMDLAERLNQLLLHVAVVPSVSRGLLGELDALQVVGDGSPLVTGSNTTGRKMCACTTRKCDCPRHYSDPDAAWGWDDYRKRFFFGHHFWEMGCSSQGADLPLALTLGPGNASDHLQGLATLDAARKRLAPVGMHVATLIEDAGHDSCALHEYLQRMDIEAIIPLSKAPAVLPERPEIELSRRGVPLCQAGEEMIKNGSAGAHRQVFCCALKMGRIKRCPLAPEGEDGWSCQPETKYGPTRIIRADEMPRLLPSTARNSRRYDTLYKQRSGSERSNAVKKEVLKLEAARHRRHSLWFIRLVLCAILQHVRAWAREFDPLEHYQRMLC